MPKGKLQVPSTLTTRKCVNRTLNPIRCKHLATFLAAIFAASLLQNSEKKDTAQKNYLHGTMASHHYKRVTTRIDSHLHFNGCFLDEPGSSGPLSLLPLPVQEQNL